MNRPIGFDAPAAHAPAASTWDDSWLTASDARAARTAARPTNERFVARVEENMAAYRAKRARSRAARDAVVTSLKVLGGAGFTIFVVAWLAVWMSY